MLGVETFSVVPVSVGYENMRIGGFVDLRVEITLVSPYSTATPPAHFTVNFKAFSSRHTVTAEIS